MEITTPIHTILANKGQDLWTVGPDANVYDAIQMMADKNIGALPVLREGQLVGILTERDYTRKVILRGRSSQTTLVSEIMVEAPLTVGLQDSVQFCLQQMTTHRVRHLPVLEAANLVGVVSIGDLVNWIIRAQDATIQHLENYVAGTYPA